MSEDERPWFSASQVNEWDLCPAKWAFSRTCPDSEPTPAQRLGTAVHKALEDWLRDGVPFDMTTEAGRIALAGRHLLPAPKAPGLEVEEWFYLELGGHRFRGLKDAQLLNRLPPLVLDHKTTRSFDFAKTAEGLKADIQAAIYAVDAIARTGAPVCDVQWTYFRTQGRPVAELRGAPLSLADITPTLEGVVRSADAMAAALKSGAAPRQLPRNVGPACRKFGGCEHIKNCLSPEERVRVAMEQQSISDVIARQMNGAAQAAGIAPPLVQPPPPAAAQPPPGAHWDGQQYQVWNGTAWSPWVPTPAPQPPPPPLVVQAINPPPVAAPAPTVAIPAPAPVPAPVAVATTVEPEKRTRKPKGEALELNVAVLKYQVAVGEAARAALAAMGAT